MGIEAPVPISGMLLEAVSNLIVGIYADHVGRGPTKARSYISGDIVVCLMEDTLTKAEKTLLDSGRGDAVTEVRAALRETMREEMVRGMEMLTGRRVRALNSGANLAPDVISDLFVLGEQMPDDGNHGRLLDLGQKSPALVRIAVLLFRESEGGPARTPARGTWLFAFGTELTATRG